MDLYFYEIFIYFFPKLICKSRESLGIYPKYKTFDLISELRIAFVIKQLKLSLILKIT